MLNTAGGYLSYTPDIPANLLANAGPNTNDFTLKNVQGHFALINYQFTQLRNAMALATILGRVLILPPLWCGLDRWWAPHTGRIPPSEFKLPFLCPADHVLNLEGE